MLLRTSFSIMLAASAPCASAQEVSHYEQASSDLEPQFIEMVDSYLDATCGQEVDEFDMAFGGQHVPKVYWNTIIEPFEAQIEVDPTGWRSAPLFSKPLAEVLDPSALNTMSFSISMAEHVLRSLEFMRAFKMSDEGNDVMPISDLLLLRSKVASSSALSKCLRADDPVSYVASTRELRRTVLEKLAAGEHCIQWDVFVRRYLDIPFETMTVAERFEAGDRVFSDHDAYLIESGIGEECEEDA